MEKAVLTLYTAIGNPERISAAFEKQFQEVTKEISRTTSSFTLTLQDDSEVIVNLSHQKDKPEFIASHIQGMANFFAQANTEKEEVKTNVIRQIQCFNCVAGITFTTDDNTDRTQYIIGALYRVAADVRGFLLYPDMKIYTADGKLLFSVEGKSEMTAFRPIANSDLLEMNRPEETEADKERIRRSITQLKSKGIPYMEKLGCEVRESEAQVKSREEMVKRAAALFTVAVYSESMLSENPDREQSLVYVDKMEELYGVKAYLTPNEQEYLNQPTPEEQTCIQFVWRYEGIGTLLWAAGITSELDYPSEIIDMPVVAAIFWQHKGIKDLMSKGISRPESEILDKADLTMRYDWACVDARIKGKEAPASLNPGVVIERHYAFNWIIGANEGAKWDDIRPTT